MRRLLRGSGQGRGVCGGALPGGLVVRELAGGSIGFFRNGGDAQPAYVMPAPFMYDSSAQNRPGERGYSERVTQTVSEQGGRSVVTVEPDLAWLTAKERVFPVVIDPTITVVPDPAAAQDTMISQLNPSTAYGSSPTMMVGKDASGKLNRGLVKFDTSMIPAGTPIRSADLNLHFSSVFGSDTNVAQLSAHEATKAWTESTATWSSMSTSFVGAHAYNQVIVDDQDTLSTSYDGPWKDYPTSNAFGGSMSYLPVGVGADSFTWNGRVPGPGDYKVEARYLPFPNRGTPTLHGDR